MTFTGNWEVRKLQNQEGYFSYSSLCLKNYNGKLSITSDQFFNRRGNSFNQILHYFISSWVTYYAQKNVLTTQLRQANNTPQPTVRKFTQRYVQNKTCYLKANFKKNHNLLTYFETWKFILDIRTLSDQTKPS